MKRLAIVTAVLITVTSVFNFAYADDKSTYTLDEAIEYAESNDYGLKALDAEVKKAQTNFSKEARNRKLYRDTLAGAEFTVDTGFAAALYKNGYMLETAEMSLNIAKRNYEAGKNELKNNVRQSFYSYLISKSKRENLERSLEHANELKSFADLKEKNGQISKLDLQSFELNVMDAQIKLSAQKRAEELSLDSLKNTMSYPAEGTLVPVGKVELCEMDKTPVEDALKLAENHTSMKNNEESYQNAKKKFAIAKAWYSSAQLDYSIEKAEFSKAENTYYKNKSSILLGVKSAYNMMLSSYETLDYLNARAGYVNSMAEVSKLRYDMGQITASDYISAVNGIYELNTTIDETKLQAVNSVYNYRMTFTYDN